MPERERIGDGLEGVLPKQRSLSLGLAIVKTPVARSPDHRRTSGVASPGLRQLDIGAVAAQGRGVGDRGSREVRDGAADPEKAGMTNRKSNTHTRGRLLRGLRTVAGAPAGQPHRGLRHAQAQEPAEHRRERAELAHAPVRLRWPIRRRDQRLVILRQEHPAPRRVAAEA